MVIRPVITRSSTCFLVSYKRKYTAHLPTTCWPTTYCLESILIPTPLEEKWIESSLRNSPFCKTQKVRESGQHIKDIIQIQNTGRNTKQVTQLLQTEKLGGDCKRNIIYQPIEMISGKKLVKTFLQITRNRKNKH